LAQSAVGGRFRVERVLDRDRAALRCLGELGVRPGVVLDIVEQAPFGGPLWVEIGGRRHALGPALTDIVFGVPS
jgi:DtxR family Mn-dependent transcriptional regulator